MDKVRVSTVTPVFRGAEFLVELVGEIDALRTEWSNSAGPLELSEAIFVLDAPNDASPQVLADLARQHEWISILTLSRNFGQHPATIAGVLHASGDWVVTMDEDLQHRPGEITGLLREAVRVTADIVYAAPLEPVHMNAWRNLTSRLYKNWLARVAANPMVRHLNSFRLIRGSVARAAASVCGHETYFDIALSWFTDRFSTREVSMADPRTPQAQRAGYSFRALLGHARRAIVSSHARVLRLPALIGLVALAISVVLGLSIIIVELIEPAAIDVRGWPSIFVSTLFFGGILSFLMAVMLEYLVNVVQHTQGKPVFFVVDRAIDAGLRTFFESRPEA